ncbi:MAG TPA: hypothetical protein VGV10_01205, partial [Thermoleophilaceae bacterium]|nr:hypothetical protein [Thermoleophilaceae bacterium]
VLDDLAVGEPDDAIAGNRELGVARAIPFEGGARAVARVAVGLDHKAFSTPLGVHLEAGQAGVDIRAWEAIPVA